MTRTAPSEAGSSCLRDLTPSKRRLWAGVERRIEKPAGLRRWPRPSPKPTPGKAPRQTRSASPHQPRDFWSRPRPPCLQSLTLCSPARPKCPGAVHTDTMFPPRLQRCSSHPLAHLLLPPCQWWEAERRLNSSSSVAPEEHPLTRT